MAIITLKQDKSLRKINQRTLDFLKDYLCKQEVENKKEINVLLSHNTGVDSFCMSYMFTFSAFLFNKLKREQAMIISAVLYLTELIIYKRKCKKDKNIDHNIDILHHTIDYMLLEEKDMNAEFKMIMMKFVKKTITKEDVFVIHRNSLSSREDMNTTLRENFMNPIFSILSLGAIFQSRSEEDIKYLKGYCNNISKLIFLLSLSQKGKSKSAHKYFNERDVKSFAQQANDFLQKFQPEKMKYLTEFTDKIYTSVNENYSLDEKVA